MESNTKYKNETIFIRRMNLKKKKEKTTNGQKRK